MGFKKSGSRSRQPFELDMISTMTFQFRVGEAPVNYQSLKIRYFRQMIVLVSINGVANRVTNQTFR